MIKKSPDASDFHSDEVNWEQLRPYIHTYVTRLVGRARLSAWRGQESDVADDITGESLYKLVDRYQRANRGDSPPIDCIHSFGKVVAYRCFIDEVRKDRHIFRPLIAAEEPYEIGIGVTPTDATLDPAELAIENLSNEYILSSVAVEITRIPRKQKHALLTDLAWLCAFDEVVTPLPCMLLKLGIQLQDYRQQLPGDRTARSQHASLLTLAYKRLATFYTTTQRCPIAA